MLGGATLGSARVGGKQAGKGRRQERALRRKAVPTAPRSAGDGQGCGRAALHARSRGCRVRACHAIWDHEHVGRRTCAAHVGRRPFAAQPHLEADGVHVAAVCRCPRRNSAGCQGTSRPKAGRSACMQAECFGGRACRGGRALGWWRDGPLVAREIGVGVRWWIQSCWSCVVVRSVAHLWPAIGLGNGPCNPLETPGTRPETMNEARRIAASMRRAQPITGRPAGALRGGAGNKLGGQQLLPTAYSRPPAT